MLNLVAFIIVALCFVGGVVLSKFIQNRNYKIIAIGSLTAIFIIGTAVILINGYRKSDTNSLSNPLSSPIEDETVYVQQPNSPNNFTGDGQGYVPKEGHNSIVDEFGQLFTPKDGVEQMLNTFLTAWQQNDSNTMLECVYGTAREKLEKELPFQGNPQIQWCEIDGIEEKDMSNRLARVRLAVLNNDSNMTQYGYSINMESSNDMWYITDITNDENTDQIFDVYARTRPQSQNIKYTADSDLRDLLPRTWDSYILIYKDGSQDPWIGHQFLFNSDGTYDETANGGVVFSGTWKMNAGILEMLIDNNGKPYTFYWDIYIEYLADIGSYVLYKKVDHPSTEYEVFIDAQANPPSTSTPTSTPDPNSGNPTLEEEAMLQIVHDYWIAYNDVKFDTMQTYLTGQALADFNPVEPNVRWGENYDYMYWETLSYSADSNSGTVEWRTTIIYKDGTQGIMEEKYSSIKSDNTWLIENIDPV